MKMKQFVISTMLGLLAAAGAHADAVAKGFRGEVVLAAAVSQSETVIKGITWRCEDVKCVGVGSSWPGVDSFVKRCTTVAAAIGPLVSFRSGERVTDKSEIATCNRLAKK